MKISVIMGIYNCENTVAEAIESIINQTYDNWELIICDDGCTDNSYSIAKKYKDLYSDKIILLRNDSNKGLNYTLNKCLKYAKGEYIARMDGDDLSLPNRLEEELNFLENNNRYAIVSTPMIYFDESGDYHVGRGNGEPDITQFAKGTPFCHAPCMVKREAYDTVKGYSVSKNRLRVEDWDLWIRMYEKGYKGFVLEKPLYKMRNDINAYKRRKFKYRFNESSIIISAVNKLKLPKYLYIYAFRPIIVGLLPKPIYMYLHKKKLKK